MKFRAHGQTDGQNSFDYDMMMMTILTKIANSFLQIHST